MADRAPAIGIYYEHPDWFRPLFAELDRRGTPYVLMDAARHSYDAANGDARTLALVFNRMSPSAYLRGRAHSILYTLSYLAHLEAAEGLRFPVVVKANIGGSGANIVRFDRSADLSRASREGRLNLGLDQTALVQEFIHARGSHITRVEVLGGRYLYAINVFSAGDSFNLCPADICQTSDGVELNRAACPVDAPKNNLRVEGMTPSDEVMADVERIMSAANIEVGGVEYIVDDRDGQRYYYDINALSNFVADAPRVVGFDPFVRLVDYLEVEARTAAR